MSGPDSANLHPYIPPAPSSQDAGKPPEYSSSSSSSSASKLNQAAQGPLRSAMKGNSNSRMQKNVHFGETAEGHQNLQKTEEGVNQVKNIALQRQSTKSAFHPVASSSSSSSSSSSATEKRISFFVKSRTASAVKSLKKVLNNEKHTLEDVVKELKTLAVCIHSLSAKESKKAGGKFVESQKLMQARAAYREGLLSLSPSQMQRHNIDQSVGLPTGKLPQGMSRVTKDNEDEEEEYIDGVATSEILGGKEPIDLEKEAPLDIVKCKDLQQGMKEKVFQEIHALRDMDLEHYKLVRKDAPGLKDILMGDLKGFSKILAAADDEIQLFKDILTEMEEKYDNNPPKEVAKEIDNVRKDLNAMTKEIQDVVLKFKNRLREL